MKRREFFRYFAAGCITVLNSNRIFALDILPGSKTGIIVDERFLDHMIAPDHPESPGRLIAVQHALEDSGILEDLVKLDFPDIDENRLELIHTRSHINSIRQRYPRSHQVAMTVVAGTLAGVDAVCNRDIRNVFCASRPPGHHATSTGKIEGFCLYNAIAIAAMYARQKYHMERIMIVDWDYHHGNGTEDAYYSDPGVLFFSTHDYLAYPGTGDPERTGKGRGEGYNINVHLDCGTGDQDIIRVFEQQLVPAAKWYQPQLILISAGFDSRKDDLLGCFDITDQGFVELTKIVMALADEYCDGKLVSVLEGGYNLQGNASAVLHHLDTLRS